LPVQGGSNVGQLANRAAVELTQEGFGKMFCLAGIGGHLGGFVQSAKDAPEILVIDGCEIGCAKAILEHAEVLIKDYLVLTGLGIQKDKDFNLKETEIDKVKEECKRKFNKGARISSLAETS
jgi:uncharacterized metal-binding protein